MFDLDAALQQWADDTQAANPRLSAHIDELVDHVRSDVERRIASGTQPGPAFAAAVREFGEPSEVAGQYLSAEKRIAIAHIVSALVWATAMVLHSNWMPEITNWLLVAYMTTTFLPLTVLGARARHA